MNIRMIARILLVISIALIAGLMISTDIRAAEMRHGVVFFCPQKSDEAIKQLKLIKKDGFNMIKLASWIWTLPTPGSELEKTATDVLNWCDRNDMAFFLLHNVQYMGEGGGLNEGVINPESALKYLTDWARVLKGHKCVAGVILGNEVGPELGNPQEAIVLWIEFRQWLKEKHGSIDNLNSAWRTGYSSFDAITVPNKTSPGWVDIRRYARIRFARFYGTLFNKGFRPVLGEKLYGEKTSLDPFLHRECTGNSMVCWDDLVAEFPVWQIKCAADTSDKPLFNSEIHLYNDEFAFGPSPAITRYRYFTSAILGEYITASFAWGMWKKPSIKQIHSATPAILDDLKRVEHACRIIADNYKKSDIAVLVTEDNYYRQVPGIENEMEKPLPVMYARMGTLGRPWRYILESDISTLKKGILVVWTSGMNESAIRAIVSLPKSIKVVALGSVPLNDEYGRHIPENLAASLKKRCQLTENLRDVIKPLPGLPRQYQQLANVRYLNWLPGRGHFGYYVPYTALEVRCAVIEDIMLVAVINNTESSITAPIPWAEGGKVTDLVTSKRLSRSQILSTTFKPLEIRIFKLAKK